MIGGDDLASRLVHASPTVRRIAALDAVARPLLAESIVTLVAGYLRTESDPKARVLMARVIERHAPGTPLAKDLLRSLSDAVDACDEPLGRHALLLARDAVEAAIVRE